MHVSGWVPLRLLNFMDSMSLSTTCAAGAVKSPHVAAAPEGRADPGQGYEGQGAQGRVVAQDGPDGSDATW
jgi:hypothetical protein